MANHYFSLSRTSRNSKDGKGASPLQWAATQGLFEDIGSNLFASNFYGINFSHVTLVFQYIGG